MCCGSYRIKKPKLTISYVRQFSAMEYTIANSLTLRDTSIEANEEVDPEFVNRPNFNSIKFGISQDSAKMLEDLLKSCIKKEIGPHYYFGEGGLVQEKITYIVNDTTRYIHIRREKKVPRVVKKFLRRLDDLWERAKKKAVQDSVDLGK
jgi:hypothetical protein